MSRTSPSSIGLVPVTAGSELTPELLEQLRSALRSLRYGSVELTVHEGVVVQIERREKVRLSARGT